MGNWEDATPGLQREKVAGRSLSDQFDSCFCIDPPTSREPSYVASCELCGKMGSQTELVWRCHPVWALLINNHHPMWICRPCVRVRVDDAADLIARQQARDKVRYRP